MSLQVIGSYLDALLFFAFGVIFAVVPKKLVAGENEDETRKRAKWMRIGGWILIFCAIAKVALKLAR